MRLLLAGLVLIASTHMADAQSDQTAPPDVTCAGAGCQAPPVCVTFTANIPQNTSPVEWRAIPGKAHSDLQEMLDYAAKHCLEGQTQ